MGVVVTFDYQAWVARYPEFAQVVPVVATMYFDEASLYHANDGSGPVCVSQYQSLYMNMVTAHLAAIYSTDDKGNSPSPLVGKIQSASEGSVNVNVAYDATNPEQWYSQTKYGASYWAATAQYRTFVPVRGWARRRFGLFPWTPY